MTIRCSAIAMLACCGTLQVASARDAVLTERISFKVAGAIEPGAAVSGELRIPDSAAHRMPAVLILHSSPGFDGRGAFYAEALNKAGIATVEIDYMHGKGMPATPRHNLPHAYQTLQHLAEHPRIDRARIGVMGFSWGGILSLLTSSDELTREYGSGNLRFAAHLGIYPICWIHQAVIEGARKDFKPGTYRRVTGRPVQILAGGKDDFDDPDSCQRFLAGLPVQVRSHYSLTVYPAATFAWDSRFSSTTYDIGAKKRKGGFVNVVADAETASRSREAAVAFFRKNLVAN